MRLIDADALNIDYYDDVETGDDEYTYAYVSKAQIDNAPTIDAVSVVRCKECKHYDKFPTWSACTYWSGDPYEQASVNDDDFCSYGERKESE